MCTMKLMRSRLARRMIACLVLVATLFASISAPAFAEGDEEDYSWVKDAALGYMWGTSRYDTPFSRLAGADKLRRSQNPVTYPQGLVVATGKNHADPISASALAGELGYSFIYVNPKGNQHLTSTSLWASGWVEAVNKKGCLKEIVIVGGTTAVPPKVEAELKSAFPGVRIDRVWGSNRYDTSRKVLAYGKTHGSGWGNTAVVASGARWPDGTSAAGLAAYLKAPIFLADAKGSVAATDLAELAKFDNVIIVGGPLVVSTDTEHVLSEHAQVTRLWGQDRYGTNLQVALYELTLTRDDGQPAFSTEAGFYLAKGTTFADYIPLAANLATGADADRGIVVMVDPGHGAEAIVEEFGAEARAARGLGLTPLENVVFAGERKRTSREPPNPREEWIYLNVIYPIMGGREFDIYYG